MRAMRYRALLTGMAGGGLIAYALLPASEPIQSAAPERCFYGRFESYAEFIDHDRPERSFVRLEWGTLEGPVGVEVPCTKKARPEPL
jgi:hypothetical protein